MSMDCSDEFFDSMQTKVDERFSPEIETVTDEGEGNNYRHPKSYKVKLRF